MNSNCQNCGAPKSGSVCEYCGTHFLMREGQFVCDIRPEYVEFFDCSGLVQRIRTGANVTVKVVE